MECYDLHLEYVNIPKCDLFFTQGLIVVGRLWWNRRKNKIALIVLIVDVFGILNIQMDAFFSSESTGLFLHSDM